MSDDELKPSILNFRQVGSRAKHVRGTLLLALGASLCLFTDHVSAQVIKDWTGAVSSDWNTPGNWSGGSAPTSSMNVIIDDVSVNIPVITGAVNSNDASIGYITGTAGSLTVSGFSGNWNLAGSLSVGDQGTGTLLLENGGKVATGGLTAIGLRAGSMGSVTVDGAQSSWTIGSDLFVGQSGIGSLDIINGGQVITGAFAAFGNLAGSTGTVTVSDGASLITVGELSVGVQGAGSLTVARLGTVSNANIVLAGQAGSTGELNIGAIPGDTAQAPGVLNTGTVSFGSGAGAVNFNHNDTSGDYSFTPVISSGAGQVNIHSGSTTFYQANGYSGGTTINGGILVVTNTSGSATGTSSVQVAAGGTLRGNGIITGPVTVSGILAPGDSAPGVLTLGQLTLNAGGTVRFRLNDPVEGGQFVNNDRVDVTGNLTLGGTLDATISAAGVYRLFNYGGTLSGSFSNTVYTSGRPGFVIGNVVVDTSIASQVNLGVIAAGQSMQFWDGGNTTPSGQPHGVGGNGIWNTLNTNWTDENGANNGIWGLSVGVFAGSAGTVTVQGNQSFDTLQFTTSGYILVPNAPGDGSIVIGTAGGGTLNVNSGVTVTIDAPIADGVGTGLTIVGGGIVNLGAQNTYSGGTTILQSGVRAGADSAFGAVSGGITLNSGIIQLSSAFDLSGSRSITLQEVGGAIDTNGFNTTLSSAVTGAGAFYKLGSGTLTIDGASITYTGRTNVIGGTLAVSGPAQLSQSSSVEVSSGAIFDISASAAPQTIQSLGGAGQVFLGGQNLVLTNARGLFSGTITGAGGLVVASGVEVLSGNDTYTGDTQIGQGSALVLIGDGQISQSSVVNVATAARFSIALTNNGSSIRSLSGGGNVELGEKNLSLTSANDVFSGMITGSGQVIIESGTATFSGANVYSGITDIQAGATLNLSGAGQVSFSRSIQSDGIFDISATLNGASIIGLSGGGNVNLGTQTLTITNAADTFTGVIDGSGGLVVSGGTQLLGGANIYTGPTTVSFAPTNRIPGTLGATAANVFSPFSHYTVARGGTLDLRGFDQTVAGLDNAGLVQIGSPATIQSASLLAASAFVPASLTVNGSYNGSGGTVLIRTFLGSDNSPSDKLVINGGSATGSSILSIVNAGGPGAQTSGDGILVVEAINGGTTAAGAFRLNMRVAQGAYDYTLYRGGSLSDENWYLRSTLETGPGPGPGNPGGTLPNIRPEVPLVSSITPIAMEYGYAMLGTLHERGSDTWLAPAAPVYEDSIVREKNGKQAIIRTPVGKNTERSPWFSGAWGRLIGDRGFQSNGNFERHGPDYDYTFAGIQAGFDIYAREQADGTLDKLGLYVGYGRIDGNVKGAWQGKAGTIDMDAYTVGAYWTHKAVAGWYTDAVVQGTWYSADAGSIMGQRVKPDGFGILASLEAGYAFQLGSGFTLEPQAQLAYQNVSFGDVSDAYGRFSLSDGESLRGRLGVRVTKTWNMADEFKPRMLTAWLRTNLWHEFLGTSSTTVSSLAGQNPLTVSPSLGGTWAEIEMGVSGQITEDVSLFATAAYDHSLDNRGREVWNGRLGVSMRW